MLKETIVITELQYSALFTLSTPKYLHLFETDTIYLSSKILISMYTFPFFFQITGIVIPLESLFIHFLIQLVYPVDYLQATVLLLLFLFYYPDCSHKI